MIQLLQADLAMFHFCSRTWSGLVQCCILKFEFENINKIDSCIRNCMPLPPLTVDECDFDQQF